MYKKCEICGEKINKLRYLFDNKSQLECKKCGTKYIISNNKICEFFGSIFEVIFGTIFMFSFLGFVFYLIDIDINMLVFILILVVITTLSFYTYAILQLLILLIFIAKFKIYDEKKDNKYNRKRKNIFNFILN